VGSIRTADKKIRGRVNYFVLFYIIISHIISSPEYKHIQAIASGTPYQALDTLLLPLRPEIALCHNVEHSGGIFANLSLYSCKLNKLAWHEGCR
jgi:hypothetical protein